MDDLLRLLPGPWQQLSAVVFALSLTGLLYTYFGYPLLLWVAHAITPRKKVDDLPDHELPPVTMVVAAFNEAAVIEEKVRNFLAIDYPPDRLNLIIGSDGSDDGTPDLATAAAAGNPRITIKAFTERRGKVNVVNDLLDEVTRPLVVMSDANTMYRSDAVRKLVRHFAEEQTGAVCGQLVLDVPDGGGASREEGMYWRYETAIKTRESGLGSLTSINGQVFAFRRALYETLPNDAITEDQHLGLRILAKKFCIRFEPEAIVNEELGDLATETGRRLRISTGNYQTFFRVGLALMNPLLGFPAFAYLSHKVMRLTGPFLMLFLCMANAALWHIDFMRWLFVAQVAFYGMALLAAMLPVLRRLAPLRIIHYFVVMNVMVARGFFRYVAGRQKVAWRRTDRADKP